jgi:hypothetical protein
MDRRFVMALSQQELDSLAAMSREQLEWLQAKIREELALHGGKGGMTMSASSLKAMTDVVGDQLMRDIVKDLRTIPEPGFLPAGKSAPIPNGSGWVKPLDHSSPSGLRYIDRAMDVQDALDKRELENRLRRL